MSGDARLILVAGALLAAGVLVSTLLQGATVEPLARALGLSNRPDAP